MKVIKYSDKDFLKKIETLFFYSEESSEAVQKTVSEIITKIRKNGDVALDEYIKKFDNLSHAKGDFVINENEISAAYKRTDKEVIAALKKAKTRIEKYHSKQLPEDKFFTDEIGAKLGWKWTSVDSVAIYVPGGTAAYPSSVLMNAIPAKVAGVKRIAMLVPAPKGKIKDVVLAAARISGVTEIYKIGGAQAIAALAYGTKTIKPVDKIVGPGNSYVAEAKRQVFGKVGIDMIAGPSEIMVISDSKTNPDFVAADLLSQAEHDKMARCILVTDNESFASKVLLSINKYLSSLERREIAAEAIKNNSAIIIVKNLSDAASIANLIAPEHLEICTEKPEVLAKKITNAGAIFLGRYTPESVGDYIAGPSHVLPTSGSAKFSSGLSVYDFLKRTSISNFSKRAFDKIASETETLAIQEGLTAHALAVKLRRK